MKRHIVYLTFLFSSLYPAVSNGQIQTFSTLSGHTIMDMTVYKGNLYVIGRFDSIGGIAADKIARFDGTNWHSLPIYLADYVNTDTYSFQEFLGELFIAAVTSDTIPEPLRNEFITKWDGVSWSVLQDSSIYPGCPSFCDGVLDMAVYDSLLLVGGDFGGTSASPNFYGFGIWDGNQWVVPADTNLIQGFGQIWDIDVNNQGIWFISTGNLFLWDGTQLINKNHPYSAIQRSIIAWDNNIYAKGYINQGNGWNIINLKGEWNDHLFAGDDLFFTRTGVLYKMDTSSFNITTVDSLVPTLGYTAYQMTFFKGKLILGLTFGRDTNGSFLYSLDSTQVISELQETTLIKTKIYPNPSRSHLILQSSETIKLIEILNLKGTTLFQKEENSKKIDFDVSDIPDGLYLISTVTNSGIRQTQKVIIQH